MTSTATGTLMMETNTGQSLAWDDRCGEPTADNLRAVADSFPPDVRPRKWARLVNRETGDVVARVKFSPVIPAFSILNGTRMPTTTFFVYTSNQRVYPWNSYASGMPTQESLRRFIRFLPQRERPNEWASIRSAASGGRYVIVQVRLSETTDADDIGVVSESELEREVADAVRHRSTGRPPPPGGL